MWKINFLVNVCVYHWFWAILVLEQFPAAENKDGFNMLMIHSSQMKTKQHPYVPTHIKNFEVTWEKCGGLSHHKAQSAMDRCFTHAHTW